MYSDKYGDMEETILACLLYEPSLMKKLKVEEKHFKKFAYLLTFFKQFYNKYHTLDTTIMFNIVKGSSEITLIDAINYLTDIFVLPSHFEEYQTRLLELYSQDKKEEWLRKKVYEKATKLYVGDISVKKFNMELNSLYQQANKIDWK